MSALLVAASAGAQSSAREGYVASLSGEWVVKVTPEAPLAEAQKVQHGMILRLVSNTAGSAFVSIADLNGRVALTRRCNTVSECAEVSVTLGDSSKPGLIAEIFALWSGDRKRFVSPTKSGTESAPADPSARINVVAKRDTKLDLSRFLDKQAKGDFALRIRKRLDAEEQPPGLGTLQPFRWNGVKATVETTLPPGLYEADLSDDTRGVTREIWLLSREGGARRGCSNALDRAKRVVASWGAAVSDANKEEFLRAALFGIASNAKLCQGP